MPLTQKKIADMAGVCQKTVSLYFKDKALLSQKMRKKIDHVMTSANYFPNQAARSIRSRQFKQIVCIAIQSLEDEDKARQPQLMAYINGASMELARAGYSLVFEPAFINHKTRELSFHEYLTTRFMDGLLVLPGSAMPRTLIERIRSAELPTVWLNCPPFDDGSERASIMIDEEAGTLQLVRHLLASGHRRIGWFGPEFRDEPLEHYSARERYRALKKGLDDYGGQLVVQGFACLSDNMLRQARELLPRLEGVDALVCYNFNHLYAIQEVFREQPGVTVPALAHYASSWESADSAFTQSRRVSVLLPETRLGRMAVLYLLERLNGREGTEFLRPLSGELLVGG